MAPIDIVLDIIEQKKQDAIRERNTEKPFSPTWHLKEGKRKALEDLEETLESFKKLFR